MALIWIILCLQTFWKKWGHPWRITEGQWLAITTLPSTRCEAYTLLFASSRKELWVSLDAGFSLQVWAKEKSISNLSTTMTLLSGIILSNRFVWSFGSWCSLEKCNVLITIPRILEDSENCGWKRGNFSMVCEWIDVHNENTLKPFSHVKWMEIWRGWESRGKVKSSPSFWLPWIQVNMSIELTCVTTVFVHWIHGWGQGK